MVIAACTHTLSEVAMCFQILQKYVEQISRLASMCRHDATGAAGTDLEVLVSMRVSPIHASLCHGSCSFFMFDLVCCLARVTHLYSPDKDYRQFLASGLLF